MQVPSILWPDIKLQKLLEHRFRLRWTKSDARTQFRQAKIGQDQCGLDKEAQDSLLEEDGGSLRHWQANRPTWSADLAHGPHRLNQGTWRIPIGPLRQLQRFSPVAPCYKYKGGRE